MTQVIITATATDVAKYNRNLTTLTAAFRPLAAQFGGEEGMQASDPQKPALTFSFNDYAKAESFFNAAAKAARARKLGGFGFRKLPHVTLKLREESGNILNGSFMGLEVTI